MAPATSAKTAAGRAAVAKCSVSASLSRIEVVLASTSPSALFRLEGVSCRGKVGTCSRVSTLPAASPSRSGRFTRCNSSEAPDRRRRTTLKFMRELPGRGELGAGSLGFSDEAHRSARRQDALLRPRLLESSLREQKTLLLS